MPPKPAHGQPAATDHAALHRRLEQLRAAMGETAAASDSPSQPQALPSPETTSRKPAAYPAVLGAAAVLIAGALWWTVGTGTTPQAAPTVRSVATAPPTAPVVASQPVPAAAAPVTAAPPPPAQPLLDEQQVRDTLETWRLDWSRRDVDAYLKHYSPAFVPANGQSRAQWEALRRKNITSRPAIRVEVNGLRIEALDPDQFRLQFLQNYISGTYLETAQPKTLRMVRSGKDWLIVGEWQGKEPASAARKP